MGVAVVIHSRLPVAAMTWTPIKDADLDENEGPLPSGLGVDLGTNTEHNLDNRLKRHSVSYYLGPTSTTGGTPPVGDSTLVGPTVDVAGSSTSDPEGIGLKLSSPPTMPLALPLGVWPLSARATSLRIVVGCTTAIADVDLYAYAVVEGSAVPAAPLLALTPDEDGLVTFGAAITGTDAHATVGTSTPSPGTQNAKPVALTIDLTSPSGVDFGYQGDAGGRRVCRLYLCILSTAGALDGSLSQSSAAAFQEGGRRITLANGWNSTWGLNPGPFHRWLKFTGAADSEVLTTADSFFPKWRGVIQGRPLDMDAPSSSNSSFVIHPPIGIESAVRTDPAFEIYTCGTITIQTITIQEVGG